MMKPTVITRFLAPGDIPTLLQLESLQWTPTQAADADTLRSRLTAFPDLCVGAFCADTGKALASLFMRPITRDDIARARRWEDCAAIVPTIAPTTAAGKSNSLFGISLTSVDPQAAASLFTFFWPHALKRGWREIYLGSPMPGFKRARENDAALDATAYAGACRGRLPRDPQLRYYHRKGFTDIVAVLPDYFPHEASLDYGVLIRGKVPLSQLCVLWRRLPFNTLQTLLGWITRMEGRWLEYVKPRAEPGDTTVMKRPSAASR